VTIAFNEAVKLHSLKIQGPDDGVPLTFFVLFYNLSAFSLMKIRGRKALSFSVSSHHTVSPNQRLLKLDAHSFSFVSPITEWLASS